MSRGARNLTKKEKDKIKLYALVDAHRWQLTGTLVPTPRSISGSDLKSRIEKAISPKSGFYNGRNAIIIDCNVWAEEVRPGDDDDGT